MAAVHSAGAPVQFCELTPSVDQDAARWAVASCRFLRDRFSVADMAFFLGIWDESCVDSLLSDAAALGSLA